MFSNNSIFGILNKPKIKDEDSIVNHLKGFKKKVPNNPHVDYIKEPVNDDIDILKPKNENENTNEKNISNNNIKIPDARYYKYKQQRRRIKEFVKEHDQRGYNYI